MLGVVIFWMALLFDLSQSSQLYACDDEIFENELKVNNWICKLDKDYDVMAVPRPFPQKLNSTIQIYEVSGVDEGGHTLTIHFKHYIQWTDKRLSYHNRSAITDYLILHHDRKNHIWYPKIMYIDSIKVEKKNGFGPGFENPHEFKIFPGNRIQLSENLKVTFSCEFDFSPYPFDKHECHLAFYDREYVDTILLNQVGKIARLNETIYETITSRNDEPLLLTKPRSDFRISVDINPTTVIKDGKLSSAGIGILLERGRLGLLLGSFYMPTGSFAILSMASYLINPDAVPGRMGLLITASLIAWNVYGSTSNKAPRSRGFSFIEVWILGVQTNIIVAIIEYACILALKRSNFDMSTKSANMDRIIKLIDLVAFVLSLIFFSCFNIFYWF